MNGGGQFGGVMTVMAMTDSDGGEGEVTTVLILW